MKTKLHLLYGGKSAEHKVSMQTAMAVMNAIDQNKFEVHPIYINQTGNWKRGGVLEGKVSDIKLLEFPSSVPSVSPLTLKNNELSNEYEAEVVFPLLHGPNGEDGTVQGMLELLDLAYVGNGVLASAAGMDKLAMKALFAQAGLNQVQYVGFKAKDWERNPQDIFTRIQDELGYPCFVKPANLGSSVGISKCKTRDELKTAIEEALQYDRKVIVEEGVTAREIEIGVLGNDDPECSVVGEIVPKTEFYDYKSKYEDGDTALIIPADVSNETYNEMKKMADKAFKALDCSGLARVDFFLKEDGTILINEVNTMPGFTPMSMFPLLWKHSGVDYPTLIQRLVELAIERNQEKMKIRYTFD
ncbi:D-alanine-D-alanine ligase [Bacillus oleivorans]|uniref:D-alanine--D-alanine ligase n=1 Tax=Bacillus oleivorans TaxID=1448271 RepID=A0A285D4G6_9BACI|nr:D-alanine--D-alanine ligase [Bacillus oleivorans]SNX74575.1 D-alanine-D-alanine ligase [Bacillus oleivorans]